MLLAPEARAELKELPPVDELVAKLEPAADGVPRELLLAWIRESLDEARADIRAVAADGGVAAPLPARGREAWREVLASRVRERIAEREMQTLKRVINATGVLLHTNLGRAPLPATSSRALLGVTAGYSNLEMDLSTGRRRSRLDPIRKLLPLVTGAEAGIAVHNNAAAVYLTLTALAAGREVVVSRGHLVEIGGSFRLPEIMAASGARLVEIGSTNRTRLDDYARAIRAETGLLLLVHPSNFRIVGFTEEVETKQLAELARERGIPLLYDIGSGALRQHGSLAFGEPRVQDALEDGADLVCFSGDKLLGGPQAGILVGAERWIAQLSRHPVARVVRLDKTALAALETTLEAYLDPRTVVSKVPLLSLLSRSEADLDALAERVAGELRTALPAGWKIEIVPTESEVGGGSLPGLTLPSRAISLAEPGWSPDALARAFRLGDPPVAGRIERNCFLLDVRALLEGEERLLAKSAAAIGGVR